MSNTCTQPLSWLMLERLALGELPASQQAEVHQHLAQCPRCQGAWDELRADERALPAPPRVAEISTVTTPLAMFWLRWLILGTASAAAVVVAAHLFLAQPKPDMPPSPQQPAARLAFKGGEIALAMMRERGGVITDDPQQFASGDRFKVLVTCPPGAPRYVVVTVEQRGQRLLALATHELSTCGNRVVLPGAFTITGTDSALVCASFHARPPRSLGDDEAAPRVCIALAPTPGATN